MTNTEYLSWACWPFVSLLFWSVFCSILAILKIGLIYLPLSCKVFYIFWIRSLICVQIFSPSLSFHLLESVIAKAELKHFDEAQSIRFFSFKVETFFYPKKFLSIPKSQRYPMISSRHFIVVFFFFLNIYLFGDAGS